jgi:predicted permease
VAVLVAKAFRFNKRASNFVTAMGVFGNSNSLPISLVMSLSQTIKGLHWDRIPGDNDDEVAARGILYLLIFQQLGQLVRWSWGYHVLLAPKDKYAEYQDEIAEAGQQRYHDEPEADESDNLIDHLDGDTEEEDEDRSVDSHIYIPAGRTPVAGASHASVTDSSDDEEPLSPNEAKASYPTFPNRKHRDIAADDNTKPFPHVHLGAAQETGMWLRVKTSMNSMKMRAYNAMPRPLQILASFTKRVVVKTVTFIWEFMNPPLWAMLFAVLVASIPSLQKLFFEEGSFINNSVTNAVKSSGGVAVPLILVVLGANLARNTMACDDSHDPEEEQIGTKLLVAALLSRMLLPTAIMAPILALTAKYLSVSILDDPIFIIVCFLLTGAPSALQLAQICQINMVFEKTMGRILFQSYVIW